MEIDKVFNFSTKYEAPEVDCNPASSPCFTFGASANQVSFLMAGRRVLSQINPDLDKFRNTISRGNFRGQSCPSLHLRRRRVVETCVGGAAEREG